MDQYAKDNESFCLKIGDFKNILNKIPKDVIISFGGFSEPFLNQDCLCMIEYTSQRGNPVFIMTTLVGLTLNETKELNKIYFEGFCVHLPNSIGDEKIKVTPEYLSVLAEVAKGPIDVHFVSFGKPNEKVENMLGALGILVQDISKIKISRAGNLGTNQSTASQSRPLICSGQRLKGNVLLPNGEVALCCMDYASKHKIGNLLLNTYEDLFKSQEFISLNSKLKKGGGEQFANPVNLQFIPLQYSTVSLR